MPDHQTHSRQGRDDEGCRLATRAALGLPLTETWFDRHADLIALAIVVVAFLIGLLVPLS